jgi:hypothetical protein
MFILNGGRRVVGSILVMDRGRLDVFWEAFIEAAGVVKIPLGPAPLR